MSKACSRITHMKSTWDSARLHWIHDILKLNWTLTSMVSNSRCEFHQESVHGKNIIALERTSDLPHWWPASVLRLDLHDFLSLFLCKIWLFTFTMFKGLCLALWRYTQHTCEWCFKWSKNMNSLHIETLFAAWLFNALHDRKLKNWWHYTLH